LSRDRITLVVTAARERALRRVRGSVTRSPTRLRRYPSPMKIIVRWLLLAAALLLVANLYSGVSVHGFGSALFAAFVLGLFNTLLRPVLVLLTLPVTLLTLGLFLFVINACMFYAAGHVLEGFHVSSFGAALIGSLLYSLCGMVIDVAMERLFQHQS
jgi:putative membrane protein